VGAPRAGAWPLCRQRATELVPLVDHSRQDRRRACGRRRAAAATVTWDGCGSRKAASVSARLERSLTEAAEEGRAQEAPHAVERQGAVGQVEDQQGTMGYGLVGEAAAERDVERASSGGVRRGSATSGLRTSVKMRSAIAWTWARSATTTPTRAPGLASTTPRAHSAAARSSCSGVATGAE